ncbi:DUF3268 family zinc-finger domain-containing protein [Bacteroides uniformis]|nr:zinc-finger-containing protein [Bacteroides uniformis]MCS3299818.1 DUF3268 family zinc-finger domain-containing protein [Bacteroides uniformis]DAJ25987.1 MAG TPA: zinc finger domain-containing protein [Caudoviricetes sp.]DAU26062.1 MAG TPA: zinc finger domain-containing protein [Caudoviricetes sp.]
MKSKYFARKTTNQLNIPHEVCHIGMFDMEDCKRVVELCKPLIGQ